MVVPAISSQEKAFLFARYFIIWSGVFLLVDLYDPIKRVLFYDGITWAETMTYVHFLKRLPLILVFSGMNARSAIKKRADKGQRNNM